jgi:hypothetical protein
MSVPLNPDIAVGTDFTDMPIAWRFTLPTKHVNGVIDIEFGTALPGYIEKDVARFSNEIHFDQDINNHDSPAVRELFLRLGGEAVKRVKRDGGDFFSGLERKARINPDGTGVLWNQLVYPSQLASTSQLIEKYISIRRSKGIRAPEWLHELSLGKNRKDSAAALALSALYTISKTE